MELVRESIILNKHIGEEKSQMLLEGDIIVPDVAPDIASILQSTARVFISKATAGVGRVSYHGKMFVDVLYLAKGDEEIGVHSISSHAHIDDFLNMEGAVSNAWVNLSVDLANIEFKVVNDRKLNYRAVIDVCADVLENKAFDAVTSIGGLPVAQQKNVNFAASNMVVKHMEQFTIRDEITLPQNLPAIAHLLQTSVDVSAKDVVVADGHVDISGDLLIRPLYRGTDGEPSAIIEFAEFELPFSGSLEIGGATSGLISDASLSVGDFIIDLSPDETGQNRVLSIEVAVQTDIKIFAASNIEILNDAYCLEQNLDIKTQTLNYNHLIFRNKNQFNVKEKVGLDGAAPEILKILRANGTVRLDDIKVVEDKTVVEGIVEANVLYVANCDENPLHSHIVHVPIRQVIETRGSRLGMAADVKCNLEHIGFNMLTGREVELRLSLNFDTLIQENLTTQFIENIEFSPIDKAQIDNLPSMVVLVAGPGDSLWSIAKKYNADLAELAEINDIDPANELTFGQKLLIVKKVAAE